MSRAQNTPTPPVGRTLYRFDGRSYIPPIPIDAFTSIQVWLPHFETWRKPKVIPLGDCDPYWCCALTIPWGQEEWTRTAPDAVCEACIMTHRAHPQESGPGYGSCGDETLYLHRLCDGRLVKL